LTGAGPRIGIFGSAFDPPHNAHVALVKAALEQLALDRLLVFPTGQAWHKARVLSEAAHRLAMARLAFEGIAGSRSMRARCSAPAPPTPSTR
jgi:nicotinate-nucleotide adenylyltransferase